MNTHHKKDNIIHFVMCAFLYAGISKKDNEFTKMLPLHFIIIS